MRWTDPEMVGANKPGRNKFSMRTGVAHLRSLPPAARLDLAVGELGSEILMGPLIHEVVHHACANSAVTMVLQYRWVELLRHSLSSPDYGLFLAESELALAADLAAAEAVLQTLAEGIALFAEFDCTLPNENQFPTVLGSTGALSWRLLATLHESDTGLTSAHAAQRAQMRDSRTIQRKASVLFEPTYPTSSNGVYLLGYLFVRELWTKFSKGRASAPLRASAFLDFVMYYFYEDWVLARIIAFPGRLPTARVVERVVERCQQLIASDLEASALAFIRDRAQRESAGTLVRGSEELTSGPFEGLNLSTDDVRQGISAAYRLRKLVLTPQYRTPRKRRATNVRNLTHRFLSSLAPSSESYAINFRSRNGVRDGVDVQYLDCFLEIPILKLAFCHLFDVDVEICGRDGHDLVLRVPGSPNERSLARQSAQFFSSAPKPGRIVATLASTDTPWRLHCHLQVENMWIDSWCHAHGHADDSDDQIRDIEREALRIGDVLQLEHDFAVHAHLSFDALNNYVTTVDFAREQVKSAADEASQAVVSSIRSILSALGWSGLMSKPTGDDFGLGRFMKSSEVRCIACASLCAVVDSSKVEVERAMRNSGHDLSDALAISARFERSIGVALIREQNGAIVTRV